MTYHRVEIEDVSEPPRFRLHSCSLFEKDSNSALCWDYSKNCGFGPEDFMSGSGILAWFKCDEGPDHVYRTQIKKWLSAQATSTKGCPFCHGKYVSVTNWLEDYPEVTKEFDFVRNKGVTPKEIVAGSRRLYHWVCRKGHKWKATASDRISGHGCFICNVGEHTDLSNYPRAWKMFDKKKNEGIDPHFVLKEQVVSWQCTKAPDHNFAQRFHKMNANSPRCIFCFGAIASSTNNLTLNSVFAAEFHPRKNGKLKPDDVALNSPDSIWWRCTIEPLHVWEATPRQRTYQKSGCHICSHYPIRRLQLVSDARSRAIPTSMRIKPALVKQWHPTKNGKLTPTDFSAGSNRPVWWKCPHGPDHEWCGPVNSRSISRTKTMACPFCDNKKVSITNSLATRFPAVASMFHPGKNGNLKPKDVIAGSSKRFWWRCREGPDHEWEESVSPLTSSKQGCPFCAGNRVSITNCISTLFPAVAKQWHFKKNGSLKPTDLVAGSHQLVWWRCRMGADHEWEEQPNKRCYGHVGCPFCSGHRASITNCLATCDPATAKQWDKTANGKLTAYDVTARSNKVVWWNCSQGKKHPPYQQSVKLRAGRMCNHCYWANR